MYCVLEDVGLLSKTNPTMVIYRMKIMREYKDQSEILMHKKKYLYLQYYFGGRLDKTYWYITRAWLKLPKTL